MIERKDKFIRIRVIGGSGIFDSIVNILKKPIVSKLLTSAGKSVASVLGERLVNRMMPSSNELARTAAPQQQVALSQPQQAPPLTPFATGRVGHPAPEVTQPPLQSSRRAQELIDRYKAKQTPQVISGTGIPAVPLQSSLRSLPAGELCDRQSIPTIQEYVKRANHATRSGKKGAGIKEIL